MTEKLNVDEIWVQNNCEIERIILAIGDEKIFYRILTGAFAGEEFTAKPEEFTANCRRKPTFFEVGKTYIYASHNRSTVYEILAIDDHEANEEPVAFAHYRKQNGQHGSSMLAPYDFKVMLECK